MAIPGSGQLKMANIAGELQTGTYQASAYRANISLKNMAKSEGSFAGYTVNHHVAAANRPNGTAPHSFSEWYSYDHDYVPQANNHHLNNAVAAPATGPPANTQTQAMKCFLIGTNILLSNGTYKAIENIEIGELVKTKDGTNNLVQDSFIHNVNRMVKIYTNGIFHVTGHHLLWIDDKWQTAKDLNWSNEIIHVDNLYYLQTNDSYIVENVPVSGIIPAGAPGTSITKMEVINA